MLFARQVPESDFPTASIGEELILDGKGCFRISRPGPSLVPIWPSGFEPRVAGEEVRILNGEGKAVARVGEGIRAGGGEVPSLEGLGSVDARTAREVQGRCPAQGYWLVGGGVRVTQRG